MRVNGKATLVHRLSFEWNSGPIPPGMVVDHMCWNRSCVRPDHLRLATPSQNQRSQSGPNRRSSTGVRGVTMRPNGRYEARLVLGNKKIQVGNFESLEDAADAIRLAREELWGEFAGNG
ncbi:HNH endonuclease [Brevibacterium oceani]|uniref:HNH endonuclease n=1 Tax=Brevibacterium oceani TaxID=358099 RepID=UPI00359CAA44